MAFDDPAPPFDAFRRLSIAPCPGGWAIKHGEGFLGTAANREEALRLLHTLQQAAKPRARAG